MHRSGLFRRCTLTSEPPVREGTTYVGAMRTGRFEAALYGVMRLFKPAAAWMADREPTHTLDSLVRSFEPGSSPHHGG